LRGVGDGTLPINSVEKERRWGGRGRQGLQGLGLTQDQNLLLSQRLLVLMGMRKRRGLGGYLAPRQRDERGFLLGKIVFENSGSGESSSENQNRGYYQGGKGHQEPCKNLTKGQGN